jgi:hypothetical protein
MDAGFLFEFPAGGRQEILAWLGYSLRDGPCAIVAAFPEGAAGVSQEQLQSTR